MVDSDRRIAVDASVRPFDVRLPRVAVLVALTGCVANTVRDISERERERERARSCTVTARHSQPCTYLWNWTARQRRSDANNAVVYRQIVAVLATCRRAICVRPTTCRARLSPSV